MPNMGSIMPIMPFETEMWTSRDVASIAVIIKTTAPRRSTQGARLKNSHQTAINNAPTTPPTIASIAASGMTMGSANLTSSTSSATTTPGQSRRGFLGAGSAL